MSLLNRLWSRADFWDKEENERQKQQFAQTRSNKTVTPPAVTRSIQNAKYGVLANNPNRQNQLLNDIAPSNINKGKALVQSALQAPGRVVTGARDTLDANTQSDVQKRLQRGEAANYFDQQKALGNKRPYQNVGAALMGSTARLLNTGEAARREVIDTGLMYGAQALGRDDLYKKVTDANQRFKQKAYQPNSGLLGQGTIFDKPEDFNTMGAGQIAKRVGAVTGGTALEVVPMSKGAGLGAKVMSKAPNAAARTGMRFASGAASGAAQDVLEQQITRDNYSPMQTALSAGFGGVLGNAGPALGALNRRLQPAVKNVTTRLADLGESGGAEVGGPLIAPGINRLPINNPDNAKVGGLKINNPDNARVGGLRINNPDNAQIAPLKINNPDGANVSTRLAVRNNTGAPLVGDNLSGAAQQSYLSKRGSGLTDAELMVKNYFENNPERVGDATTGKEATTAAKNSEPDVLARAKANMQRLLKDNSGSAELGGPLLPTPKKLQEKLASANEPALSKSPTTPNQRTQALEQSQESLSRSLSNNTPKDRVLRDIQRTKQQIIDTEADAILATNAKTGLKKQVLEQGGVSSSAYESFPSSVKRRGGMSADKMAQVLGFDSEDAFVKALSDDIDKPRITRAEARIQALKNLEENNSEFAGDWREVVGAEKARTDELSRFTGAEKVLPNQPSSRMSQAERNSLFNNVPAGTERRLRVEGAQPEKNIPVSKLTRDGDTVTATNVNPNIKKGEKRFAVNDAGELIEDRKGAYRIFTDDEGKVTQVRIGNEVYTSKDYGDLSDVNDYGSTLATMRRNVERAFGKETGEKLSRFLVDHQQAQTTKLIERQVQYKQGLKQLADDLGINFGVGGRKARQVSAAIQDFGEGKLSRAGLYEKYGKDYGQKIVDADKWFRQQYDTLLDEMNSTLTKYGYDPVPKRKDYYTHFQDETLWQKFGLKMQEIRDLTSPTMQDAMPDKARGKISNKLAGESEFTQPNKRFNPFAQRREGDQRTADAFQAFERYLNPTLNNIYMTPSITRARVISKAVAQDADIMGKDANGVVIQMKEWANHLAGKSNRWGDRQLSDSRWGRKALNMAQWAQKKAGQNTIVGNLSTAVMQPIVLSQTAGRFGYKNTILAAMQEMSTAHGKNAPIRQSGFMKRRYAEFLPVTAGKMDRARDIANTPLEVVEQTAARITWNAAHNDALSRGLKGAEAIRQADIQTEKTLAGRAIGERPELFRSKALGPFTMFQLEVNNFWQQFGKEMTKAQAAKTLVAAYAFNLLLQEVSGRQVGFNPIDAAIDSYTEIQKEDKPVQDKAKSIGQRWAGEFVDNAPFIAPLANMAIGDRNLRNLLGPTSNVGRFGVSSPLSALMDTTNVGGIPVPQNLIMPFGGAQAKKTYEGLQAYLRGGVDNKDGERTVDAQQSPGNLVRGSLFGKNAIPEINAYNKNIGRKKVDQVPVPNQVDSRAGNMGKDSGLTVKRNGKDVKVGDLPLGERFQEQIKKLGETGDSAGVKKTVREIDTEVSKIFEKYGLEKPKIDTQAAEIYADYHKRLGGVSELEKRSEERKLLRNLYKSTLAGQSKDFFGLSSDRDMRQAVQDGLVTKKALEDAVNLDNYLVSKGLQSSPTIGNKLREELGYDKIYADGDGRKGGGRGRGGRASYDPYKFAIPRSRLSKSLQGLVEQAGQRSSGVKIKKTKRTPNVV